MADVGGAGGGDWDASDGVRAGMDAAAWSGLARAQYAALARMRWEAFRNALRWSNRGGLELGARGLVFLVYALVGVALGSGVGAAAYFMAVNAQWRVMPVLVWAVFLLWQMVPVTMASFQEQFDLGGLLRFPVGFGTFYGLYLIFGLVDASTILGGICCLGLWGGVTAADASMSGWVALGLAVFAAFNILLTRAILVWVDRWLAQRKTREVVSALFLLFVLGMQFLNPVFRRGAQPVSDATRVANMHRLAMADAVQRWLPAGLAAREMERAAEGRVGAAWGALGLLGIYTLGAGTVLGVRLRADYRGENLGEAPARQRVRKAGAVAARGWLVGGSGPMAAVMEKDFRTLMRSLPLLYSLGAPLLMVLVFGNVFRNTAMRHSVPLALLASLGYAMVGFTQLFYNNMGAEGAGIQLLFLSPTPIRTVMLAKNVFHALLFGMDMLLVVVLASWRMGRPDGAVLAATGTWLLFALPVHLAAGNVLSLKLPYRANLGRIGRQRGFQAGAMLSLVMQAAVLGVGAGVFALCTALGRVWMATPVFLVLAAVAAFAWLRGLRNAEEMANRSRDSLLATLVKAE